MRNFFDQLQSAFLYTNGNDLFHSDGGVIVTAVELEERIVSINKITDFLYRHYYSKHNSKKKEEQFEEISIETDDVFISRLAALYSHKKQASENWIVKEILSEHTLKVCKNEITLTIDKTIHLPEHEQKKKISNGDLVTILFSCHFPNISYGFYAFKSDAGEIDTTDGVGRLYFNLRFESAVDFTAELLGKLYDQNLKFDYKIFKSMRTQYRIDSAVLYFSLNDYAKLKDLIFPYLLSVPHLFNNEVSAFHCPVFDGIGFAEEPLIREEHESYGLNRCKIIAEAIYDSLDTLSNTGNIPMTSFVKKFEDRCIDPEKIYLNPNSKLAKELIF